MRDVTVSWSRNLGTFSAIASSLRTKQRIGIVRYKTRVCNRKFVALCLPPTAMAIEIRIIVDESITMIMIIGRELLVSIGCTICRDQI